MPPPPISRSAYKRLAVWLFILFFLVAFGTYQVSLNRRYFTMSQARQAAYQMQEAKNRRAEMVADFALSKAHRGGEPTIRDAEVAPVSFAPAASVSVQPYPLAGVVCTQLGTTTDPPKLGNAKP